MTQNINRSSNFSDPGVPGMVSDWGSDKQAFDMPLGQADDVDLPAQRYLHIQCIPDRLYECAHVSYRCLAEFQ